MLGGQRVEVRGGAHFTERVSMSERMSFISVVEISTEKESKESISKHNLLSKALSWLYVLRIKDGDILMS